MNIDYKILPVKTSKDDIKQPKLAEDLAIPRLGSVVIIVGQAGSGKTVLLTNLVSDKRFYGGHFDKILLISPTACMDDVQKSLNVKPSMTFDNLEEAVGALKLLQEVQGESVEKKGSGKTQNIAVICDDCVSDAKFMKDSALKSLFVKSRHFNITLFFLSQHLKSIPPVCRLQASALYFFAVSNSEAEIIAESFAPPNMKTSEFKRLIQDAVNEKYAFLTISMKSPWETRFRRGLAMVINLDDYRDQNKMLSSQTNSTDGQTLFETGRGGPSNLKRKDGGSDAVSATEFKTRRF